jgi:hypothetical protein
MIHDFQYGDGEEYEKYPIGYDDYNLWCGIEWAKELIGLGIEYDTWWDINLNDFIKWCRNKINNRSEYGN